MRHGPVVAIDGPSGSGKSTVARALARRLGVPHVDTGALYRAGTLAALRAGVDLDDGGACAEAVQSARIERRDGRTLLDRVDVEDEIRGDEVTAAVSAFSAHPAVREAMIDTQRAAAHPEGGVVEGRDIGTVVFPDADLKIFLTASAEERARRRAAEMGREDVDAVARAIRERDDADAGREVAPLLRADDAWEVDTTGMDAEETVDAIAALAEAVWRDRDEAVPVASPAPTTTPDDAGVPQHPAVRARRSLPRIAVVGRPNVGKSTLVNRIVGARRAIVEERPGVTRDRTEHIAEWGGKSLVVVDTGGWEHAAEGLVARVVEQAERAIDEADLVLFVVDVTVGALADDELYARLLRRTERPVLLVANKTDSDAQMPMVHELYGLGLGDPHPVSAAHGRGVGDLLDAVVSALPPDEPEGAVAEAAAIPRVAIVGRPNVGKSSIFNRLVGEERAIVDAVPHTTRDAVDTLVELDDEPWIFADTAGLRRRYRRGEETELYSVDRTRRAVGSAHLALFVIDAGEPLGEQDQRLAAMLRDAGCGVVLVLNKWDRVDEDRRRDLERELDRLLRFMTWAPRVNVSALTGRGMARIGPLLTDTWQAYRTRIPTAELNAWLQEAVERVPPPAGRGRRPVRIRYMTQAETAPPTFVVFVSGRLQPAYARYLERELRARYGFLGTPIRITQRGG